MFIKACDIAIFVFIIFIPPNTRCHGQQLLYRNIVVDGPLQVRDIVRDLIIDALDKTVLDRGAYQARSKRFGNGETCPSSLGIKIKSVFFQSDFAILNYDQTRRALLAHISVDIDGDVDWFALWQWENRISGLDNIGLGQNRYPVECAKRSIALWYRPEQHVTIYRQVGEKTTRILVRVEIGKTQTHRNHNYYSAYPFIHKRSQPFTVLLASPLTSIPHSQYIK